MIDKDTARGIALAEINKPERYRAEPLECVILDKYTREEDFGWVFFYQSKSFVETGEFSHQLAGNGPIVITREDGNVHRLGSNRQPDYSIAEFREQFARKSQTQGR